MRPCWLPRPPSARHGRPCSKGSRCRFSQGPSATRPYGELQRVGDQCGRKIRQAPKRRRASPSARHGKLDVPCVVAPIPGPAPTRLRSRPKVPKLTPCSDGRPPRRDHPEDAPIQQTKRPSAGPLALPQMRGDACCAMPSPRDLTDRIGGMTNFSAAPPRSGRQPVVTPHTAGSPRPPGENGTGSF